MKLLALSALLLAIFSVSYGAEINDDQGNPEIEADVSVCAKEEKQRESQYRQLLNEPYSCGTVLIKRPLVSRSSQEYQSRFEQAKQRAYFESKYNSNGIRELCELLAFFCMDRNAKLTFQEKQEALQAISQPPEKGAKLE